MDQAKAKPFKVDERIVYPSQGVGRIVEIREKPFKDAKILYYIIYLEFSDMTVMVPVDKAAELGIRAIVPKSEAEKALAFISEEYAPIPSDWKLRYQMNLDLLKKGSVLDIASVVRSLYHRSKIKELPILERKLYDSALNILQDEISFSLGKPKEDIAELIRARLESWWTDPIVGARLESWWTDPIVGARLESWWTDRVRKAYHGWLCS